MFERRLYFHIDWALVAAILSLCAIGVAPGCRLLAVKIFQAAALAPDERVADAIRWSAKHAAILSCSDRRFLPPAFAALDRAQLTEEFERLRRLRG